METAREALKKLEDAGTELLQKSIDRHVINPNICTNCTHLAERMFTWKDTAWMCDIAFIDEQLISLVEYDKNIMNFKIPAQCVFILEQVMSNDKVP